MRGTGPLRWRGTSFGHHGRLVVDARDQPVIHKPSDRLVGLLAPDAERKLVGFRWPGNVRELANCLERAAIMADGERIVADNLWLDAVGAAGDGAEPVKSLAELEREAIVRALQAVDGNRRKAAELLGIGERTLYDKLKRMGLEEPA